MMFLSQRHRIRTGLISVCLLSLLACGQENSEPRVAGRWYTQSQVDLGKTVYTAHCLVCHGTNAKSTPDWRIKLSNGTYPPPPLNGTAHTWHHSLSALMRTIENGGVEFGGVMPGFKDDLSGKEILAVIAYVQQFWPEEIYEAWRQRGGLK